MRKISIYNELYDAQICYLIGGTVPDLQKYIKRKHKDAILYSWGAIFDLYADDIETSNAYQFHVTAPLGDGEIFYVWMAYITSNLLFHETFHLPGDIFYTRAMPYTEDSEETYAYLGAWIFERVFKRLNGKLPKK